MRIYIVKHPEISPNNKVLYNKSLEVLSGEVLEQDDSWYKVSVSNSHRYSKRYKWWRTNSTTDELNWIKKDHTNISCPSYSYYTTLEQAIASKLVLLSNLDGIVDDKLTQIRNSLLNGTEGVNELLEAHKNVFPELFL